MEVPNIIAEEGLNVGALVVLLFKAILDLAIPSIQTQKAVRQEIVLIPIRHTTLLKMYTCHYEVICIDLSLALNSNYAVVHASIHSKAVVLLLLIHYLLLFHIFVGATNFLLVL